MKNKQLFENIENMSNITIEDSESFSLCRIKFINSLLLMEAKIHIEFT